MTPSPASSLAEGKRAFRPLKPFPFVLCIEHSDNAGKCLDDSNAIRAGDSRLAPTTGISLPRQREYIKLLPRARPFFIQRRTEQDTLAFFGSNRPFGKVKYGRPYSSRVATRNRQSRDLDAI